MQVKVVFGQNEAISDKIFMDTAREMRTSLAPMVLKLGDDKRGEASAAVIENEHKRRAALLGRSWTRPRSGASSAALSRIH